MGTNLDDAQGDRVWLSLGLLFGRFSKLAINEQGVRRGDLIGLFYGRLVDKLENDHSVHPFSIDWRLSPKDEGLRFARLVESILDDTDRPVSIVAHSQGGLVAQSAIAQSDKLASAMKIRTGSRLIMLGTPYQGTYIVPHLFLGHDLSEPDSTRDGTFKLDSVREVMSGFPGLLAMMPRHAKLDLFSADTWATLYDLCDITAQRLTQQDLDKALEFRQWIDSVPLENSYTWYIRGEFMFTPHGIRLNHSDPEQATRIRFQFCNHGDGISDWRLGSATMSNVLVAPNVNHVLLSMKGSVIRAIRQLIKTGRCDLPNAGDYAVDPLKISSNRSRFIIPPLPV